MANFKINKKFSFEAGQASFLGGWRYVTVYKWVSVPWVSLKSHCQPE